MNTKELEPLKRNVQHMTEAVCLMSCDIGTALKMTPVLFP